MDDDTVFWLASIAVAYGALTFVWRGRDGYPQFVFMPAWVWKGTRQ